MRNRRLGCLATGVGQGRTWCTPIVNVELIGLVVGDAVGAAVEFQMPGTFPEVIGFRGGGPHGLAPGEWTDDTSMALALADSISEVGWDLND